MRTKLIIIYIFTCLSAYSQDSVIIKQIDDLVESIDNSGLQTQRDTLKQDHPDLGLKMTTYLSMIVDSGKLIKYVNHVQIKKNRK